jgi:hypothetical protein
MSTLDSMLERNKDLAARQSAAGTLMPSLPRALPNVKAITSSYSNTLIAASLASSAIPPC